MASSRVSGERLEKIWQQAREPLFWLNADRKLVWVNRAWEELTGYPAESVLGLACNAHGPTRAGGLTGLVGSFYPPAEAIEGRAAGQPTLIIHASGERKWRRVEFWPLRNNEGALLGLFGLVGPADAAPYAPDAETQRLRTELLEVRGRLQGRYGFDSLVGRGPAHRRLLEAARRDPRRARPPDRDDGRRPRRGAADRAAPARPLLRPDDAGHPPPPAPRAPGRAADPGPAPARTGQPPRRAPAPRLLAGGARRADRLRLAGQPPRAGARRGRGTRGGARGSGRGRRPP